jgi:hypothetical protein
VLKNVVQCGQVVATALIGVAFLGMIATVMLFDRSDT